jgi:DNA polymerase III subunit gamma/tau
VLPAVQSRSIPVASLLGEARPAALEGETLTLEFPASADFHRRQAEEQKNLVVIRDALYEVTGHRLGLVLALGEEAAGEEPEDEGPLSEEDLISMFKDTFDAQEVEEHR